MAYMTAKHVKFQFKILNKRFVFWGKKHSPLLCSECKEKYRR